MQENISLGVPRVQASQLHDDEEQEDQHEKLELSKYCRFCRKHTAHKEGKV